MHFRNPGMFFPQTCHSSAQGRLGMCCQPGSAPVAAGCWPAPRCPQASPRLRMRSKAPCGCLHRDPPRCPVPPPLPLPLLCGNAGTLMCIIKRIKAWNIPRLHLPGSLWSMGRPAGSPHSPGQPVSRLGTQGRAGGAIPALLLVLLPSQGLLESKCKHENMYLAKKTKLQSIFVVHNVQSSQEPCLSEGSGCCTAGRCSAGAGSLGNRHSSCEDTSRPPLAKDGAARTPA